MTRDRVLPLLENLPDGTSEMYFHPTLGDWDDRDPAAEGYQFEGEYAALIDADVREAVTASGATLIAYRDI